MSMAWVAVGSAVIGAGASIYGSNRAASASNSASRRAADTQLTIDERNRSDLAPYRQAGYGALDQLSQLYGISRPSTSGGPGTPGGGIRLGGSGALGGSRGLDAAGRPINLGANMAATGGPDSNVSPPANRDLTQFFTSPQYEFNRSEGLRGITNSRSVTGSGSGGNAIRGAIGFASNLASGEFNSYVDRLFGIAGLGSGATEVGVQSGNNTAGNLASIYMNAGNARASAYMAGASGVNNAIQGGLGNWAFSNYLNQGNSAIAPSPETFSYRPGSG